MTMQTNLRLQQRPRVGWDFCLPWALIMAAFTLLATLGTDGVERPIVKQAVNDPLAGEGLMVLGLALCVAALGIAQGLILRPYLDGAGWWGLAIGVTLWLGSSLTELVAFINIDLLTAGFVADFLLGGLVCSVLQWLILRRQVARAGWWVLAWTLGWVVLFAVAVPIAFAASALVGGAFDSTANLAIGYAVGGAAMGAATGAVLVWLLRHPAPASAREVALAAQG
jgi:hypothetical protein